MYKDLNPFNLPIYGKKLIQGSAGTGKTYFLIILYVRLLLGLTNTNESYKGYLTVKDILLITFNDELTKILKSKIINLISRLKLACLYNKSTNIMINEFLLRIHDRFKAFIILELAEKEFQEASIFNIHNFCIRILSQYADYKSYQNCEYNLLKNENFLYNKFIISFWKEHISKIKNLYLYKFIINYWPTYKDFIKVIVPLLKIKDLKFKKKLNCHDLLIEEIHTQNINIIFKIKSLFNIFNVNNLINNLKEWNLNLIIYSLKKIKFYYNKIQAWSLSNIIYPIPKEIIYFTLPYLKNYSYIVISKDLLYYNKFYSLGCLLNKFVDIKTFVIQKAILNITQNIILEKNNNLQITYDDLLILTKNILLSNNLEYKESSNNNIMSKYSIVLIDEFQDLNVNLVNIFYNLYILNKIKNIILFADPKQSIYNFMGSDIYYYLKIKKTIKEVYNLKINWRSSDNLINNINWLFKNIKSAFLLKDIRFENIYSSKLNNKVKFYINGIEPKAFTFWYYTNKDKNNLIQPNVYKNIMAKQCAYQIKEWLFLIKKNKAQIIHNNKIRNLSIRDIVILVKDKQEAYLVKKELYNLNITAIYSSYTENVFNTVEAEELLKLLKFIFFFKNIETHRHIASNNILYISSINKKINNKLRTSLLEVISYYKNIWLKAGILCMLKVFCKDENIYLNICHNPLKQIILYNIFHLGYIIQHKSFTNKEPAYILRWLENKIYVNNHSNNKLEHMRFMKDNVITILSIHKSKGLQYPIVCLPFISALKINKNYNVYYNTNIKKFVLDLENPNKVKCLSTKHQLKEDLRLLYVALTRAICHCCIGISPINQYVKSKTTYLHNNPLGYLLQKKQALTVQETNLLLENISIEKTTTITVVWLINTLLNSKNHLLETNIIDNKYAKNTKQAIICKNKSITSFTSFYKKIYTNNKLYEYKCYFKKKSDKIIFPKGIHSGKFFHYLLESINYCDPLKINLLKEKLIIYGYYDKTLLHYLYKLLKKILIYPFNSNGLNLYNISNNKQLREVKFILNINKQVKLKELNKLFYKYLNIKIFCKEDIVIKNNFTGIIDLIFFWKGKYYILDFKSNVLGHNKYNYKIDLINNIIKKNYYWIQYHLYTLALHRLLSLKHKNYDYMKLFGGVYYFFIRSVDYIKKHTFDNKNFINNYGIFYAYPEYKLINELNYLLKK